MSLRPIALQSDLANVLVCFETWQRPKLSKVCAHLNLLLEHEIAVYDGYYSIFCMTLLIRKTINAATVMFAVMEIIQKIINAVIVMPVKMCQSISKHIMFRCHYRFLLQI